MKIKIESKDEKKRLDKFLTEVLTDYSRSQIQKMIKSGQVMVGGKTASVHCFLKIGDEVEIGEPKEIKEEKKVSKLVKKNYDLKKMIVSENDEYLIINKPAGLTAHGADHITEETLADIIIKKYPKLKKIGDDPARPSIVHRLDKEASGLMAIPKTQDSFDNLKRQFQKRTVKKEYTALVYGQIARASGQINFPIKRSSAGHKMAALPETVRGEKDLQGARRAVTEFKIKERFINYTLLKVKIITGRTHQIRCHLNAYGFPLVGDDLYSTKKSRDMNKKNNINRVFLAATKLGFKNLAGEEVFYEIDLPGELKNFLERVK
jgi:23S rRNA pseudouridine1911/1915/1917 synthase